MNQALAKMALYALTAKGFETERGYCSRFARQVCEAAYGDLRFNDQWRTDAHPSAKKSALAFKAADYAVSGPPQIGDILFKTVGSGGFGHVGIYTERGVAENSSYHAVRSENEDARGLRSLAQFGPYQIIVRLPPRVAVPTPTPQPAPSPVPVPVPEPVKESALLVWNRTPFPVLFDDDRRPYIRLAELLEKGNHQIIATTDRMDEHPPRYYLRSAPLPTPATPATPA